MTLTNLRKKFDMSGTVFWKQPLREIVENSVLKKSLKNICEGVLNKFYKKKQESYKKSHLCLHYTFLIFLNTARESGKSYKSCSVFWP